MTRGRGSRPMPTASRVLLVPPEAWAEEKLLDAARNLAPLTAVVRPGDELGGFVVVGVEPEPGSKVAPATELEIRPDPRAARGAVVDLAVLLDVSESMGDPWSGELSRIEAARKALDAFLARPQKGVGHVTVLEYSRAARVVAGPAPLGEAKLGDVPATRGASHTATALDGALARLAADARSDRCQSLLVLTDGAGEVSELRLAAKRAGRLQVPVHVIVFAPETDPVFDEVAQASGGSVQRAALPLEIDFVHEGAA